MSKYNICFKMFTYVSITFFDIMSLSCNYVVALYLANYISVL